MAISLFLIGFFMMINRRKALTQVLALLSLENGLFLAAISLTYGMPLIVELGVFFDVLVAVMVLGILVYRIRETFESMDVSRLAEAARMTLALSALLAIPSAAAGALSFAARGRAAMEAVNLTAFGCVFCWRCRCGGEVLRAGTVSLWNGFLYADALSALVILLTASVALVCSVYAVGYLREDERSGALEADGMATRCSRQTAHVLHA